MSHAPEYQGRTLSGQLIASILAVVGVCWLVGVAVGAIGKQTRPESHSAPATTAVGLQPIARLSLTAIPRQLPIGDQFRFITGRSFFEDRWVVSGASTTLRDGLGPMFSARNCSACHQGGGRSSPVFQTVFSDVTPTALTLRFDDQYPSASSLPIGTTWAAFVVPQAIPFGAANSRKPEGSFQARAQKQIWHYPDGEAVTLLRPQYRLENAPVEPSALSVRIAPSLDLAAKIDQVAASSILALADPTDQNGDGVSGRVHPAIKTLGRDVVGRFGLKARHVSLREQVAAALNEDLGITSTLFTTEACGDLQPLCLTAPNGRGTTVGGISNSDQAPVHEIGDQQLSEMVLFLSNLDVPAGNPAKQAKPDGSGATLFAATGCAVCHTPSLRTHGTASVSLFSNLLVHDMGPELADSGAGAGELGREWRTAPLKNIRLRKALTLHENYLHDGRAQTLEQAIIWHGGEGGAARDRFSRLNKTERQALLDYVGRL